MALPSTGQSGSTNAPTNTATSVPQQPKRDNLHSMDDKFSDPLQAVDQKLFQYIQSIELDKLQDIDVSCALPFLVKLLLNPYFTNTKQVLKLIFPKRNANDVIQSLQTKPLEVQDLQLNNSQNLEPNSFESVNADDRIKVVALEFLRIQEKASQSNLNSNQNAKLQSPTLFDNPLYLEDITTCFFAIISRTTTIPVMNILDVSETLLHVKYGPTLIVRLVVNIPERCYEVCQSLITFGEHQDECEKINEVSEQRAKTLRALCQLNPTIASTVRSLTIQMCRMPSLTMMITLDRLIRSLDRYDQVRESIGSDVEEMMDDESHSLLSESLLELENSYDSAISFITGILLGMDETPRAWFAQYIKSAQQKRIDQNQPTILSNFRSVLLTYIQRLFPCFLDTECPNEDSVAQYKVDQAESNESFMNRKLIQATATLRVYCALRGIGMLKLNPDEHETLLRLVTCRQEANQTSINLATTGVCTLLVCSSMINNQKDEKRAAEWLKWLIKESHYGGDSSSNHGKCSISELLLLIAIHFQNNHTNQIAELVHATLGLKLQAKFSVTKCKSLFVQEVFTDQMIAEHAVKVPVTKCLDNTIKEFLPIHCIHQLLESRSFSKHQVPIEEWIFKQICESRKPIHHMLPDLIAAYVNSIMISTSVHGHCGTNQPIAEEKIQYIFSSKLYSPERNRTYGDGCEENKIPSDDCKKRKRMKRNGTPQKTEDTKQQVTTDLPDGITDSSIADIEVAQILLLYYLMLYEDVRLKESKKPDSMSSDRIKLSRYNSEVWSGVPVFYLLQLVRDNQESFGPILPPLLKLVATQFPHLCSIQHWLNTSGYNEPYKSKIANDQNTDQTGSRARNIKNNLSGTTGGLERDKPTNEKDINAQLIEGFECIHQDYSKLSRTIYVILMKPRDEIWMYVDTFIKNWTKVLKLEPSRSVEQKKLVELTAKLWWKFNTVFPSRLWVMTINSLRMIQNGVKIGSIKSLEYTWDELIVDPLIVLRCDVLVFRNPEYLNILLHILTAFLAASRRSLQDQVSEQTGRQRDLTRDKNLEELKTTLVLAQTAAAIQILLEFCLPTQEEQDLINLRDSNDGELNEREHLILERFEAGVSCICEHLHQVFIADTNLAKLVHFQTYPSELLATTSNKIPSMHICLDFIPELLSQSDSSKQVFVIELTSHLCEKYAITKSLNVAKLCFNVAYTLLQLLPSDKRAQFYIPALPALLRICKVFPILQEDARIILNQINQISLAHLASTSSRLSLGSSRPFEGMSKMSWMEVEELMRSFDLHDSLHICIQKCMLDLEQIEEKDKQQLQQLLIHDEP